MIDYESWCTLFGHHNFSFIWAAIREDIVRFATFSEAYQPELNLKTKISIFLKPAILCLLCYRIGHYLYVRRWMRLARAVSRFNLIVHKANIPSQSCIGPGCFLGHCPGTIFHGIAGRNLTMYSLAVCCPKEDSFGGPAAQGPRLGDGVTVGAHAVVIGPVTVGDNTKVATNTWVYVDCPCDTLVFSAKISCRLRPPFRLARDSADFPDST